MMGNIRAIIFDFGGVLVRMVDDRPRLKLAETLGVPLSHLDNLVFFSDSARRASMGEIKVKQHWAAVADALGIPKDDMPKFLEQYWSADDVNWVLLDFIKNIRPRYKVGLLSNAWDDLRQTMHDRWSMDILFTDMVISAEVGLIKPDARIYQLALNRLGVQPAEAIFIDDMLINVEAARREGMYAIQYLDNQQTLSEMENILSVPDRAE